MKEVVVVGDPEGVDLDAVDDNIRAECGAFDLGWDLVRGDAAGVEGGDDVEEESLLERVGLGFRAGHVADVCRSLKIDFEDLFDLGFFSGGVCEAFAVTLVDEELVVVKGNDVADTRAGGEDVWILVRGAA